MQGFQKIKNRILIILFSINLFYGNCQFSLSGIISFNEPTDYVPTFIMNAKILLMEKDSIVNPDKAGVFSFKNLEKGIYSLKIESLNKIIIKNIVVDQDIFLDTLKIMIYYPCIKRTSLASKLFNVEALYKDNGAFGIDTSNQVYYDGLVEEGEYIDQIKEEYRESWMSLYRKGEWTWNYHDSTKRIEHYDMGRLNGIVNVYYNNENINYSGAYTDNRRNGIWKFYTVTGKKEFEIEILDDFVIIDLERDSIKGYNSNLQRIYSAD